MKKLSLIAALLVATASSATSHGESFNGAYIGGVTGFKANSAGTFDTASAKALNSQKFHMKKKGLIGGLSLGWGGQMSPNFYLGLQIDFLLGSGSKKVEKNVLRKLSRDLYVARWGNGLYADHNAPDEIRSDAAVVAPRGRWARYHPGHVIVASGVAPGCLGFVPRIGTVIPDDGDNNRVLGDGVWAVMAPHQPVAVTRTITLKDRFSITPVVQAGYLFKAALAGKDVLGYVEVGPHFAFTKLSVEIKNRAAHAYRLGQNNIPVAVPVGACEKTTKTSVDTGIALGAGLKVAVSDTLLVSLGYRFTKIPGSRVKATFGDKGLNKVKIPSQSHNLLVGLAYTF